PSCGSFVENFPAPRLLDPVLALAGHVAESVGAVVLQERDEDEVPLPGIAEHRDLAELDLDPLLRRVHGALVSRPLREILPSGAEALRIVREVALRVTARPVGAPLLERGIER